PDRYNKTRREPQGKKESLETLPRNPRDGESRPGAAAAGADRLLLALRAPDPGLVFRHVRRQPRGGAPRHGDPALHRPAGLAHGSVRPAGGARRPMADARRHGGARAVRAPARHPRGHRDPAQRADPGRDEPDPLAEPLARGAPELAVLPERL